MPRSEEVISIFLASPGDVAEERKRVLEVVSNWNRAWSRHLGLRLELLRWEDDSYPDIGEDGQDVINRQIPTDWDLFIGIMWARFGTPTGRSGSGTQEEYDRAITRHNTTKAVSLLFYFKDAPIPPSKVDVDQLKLVQSFKKSAQLQGLLTWDFPDVDQFEKLVELHITKHVQEWRKTKGDERTSPSAAPQAPPEPSTATEMASSETDDDAGYLDLVEMLVEQSAEVGSVINRITAAQQELTERTNTGREELERLRDDPNASPRTFRSSIATVAGEMLKFTERVEVEVPLFRKAIDLSITTLIRLAALSAEIYPERVEETKQSTFGLLQMLISAKQSTSGFRDSTAALPRLTKELNIAKRKQVETLNSLVAELENGERLLIEGLNVIQGLGRT